SWLSRLHPQFRTPALATMVFAAWVSVLVVGVAVLVNVIPSQRGAAHFYLLTDFAMFWAVVFGNLAVAAIFFFRLRQPDAPRTYRCWGYPVLPALYVLVMGFVAVNTLLSKTGLALVGVGFIGVGALVYGIQWLRGKG